MVKSNIAGELNRRQTGNLARSILGEGSEAKIENFVDKDLTREDLTDPKSLKEKLQKKFGIDGGDAEKMAKTIQSDVDNAKLGETQILALSDPERDAKRKELEDSRAEIQKEIETVGTEKGGQLRNLNMGATAFAAVRNTFKELQKKTINGAQVTAKDVAEQQGKDWDKMSEKEKKSFGAAVDIADSNLNGKENKTTKEYKRIEKESIEKATKEINERSGRIGMTDEEKKQAISERAQSIQKEEIEKAGIDAKALEKGEEEENKNFDPKEAVDRISRLLEGIASKLGVNTETKSDNSANAKTENNGFWANMWKG